MACATACSDCAVELASRAGGAQCSAKSAFIVHAAPAVCHRLLPECGEVMGGEGRGRACARDGAAAGVVARIGGSGYPWRARRADSIPPHRQHPAARPCTPPSLRQPPIRRFPKRCRKAPARRKNHQGFSWWKTLPEMPFKTSAAIRVDRRFLAFRGVVENNVHTPSMVFYGQ